MTSRKSSVMHVHSFDYTKSVYCWRNTHWLRRNLYDDVILDQMALLPLGLTWVWINIPDSYLTFIKHVIGSGPWLIWTHQFVLSHREVRTISLFTRMGIFICLRGIDRMRLPLRSLDEVYGGIHWWWHQVLHLCSLF